MAQISSNGRFVAFASDASTLVTGDTNGVTGVFLRDLWNNVTRRVTIGVGQAPADGTSAGATISPNSSFVGFSSYAGNLTAGPPSPAGDAFVRGPF